MEKYCILEEETWRQKTKQKQSRLQKNIDKNCLKKEEEQAGKTFYKKVLPVAFKAWSDPTILKIVLKISLYSMYNQLQDLRLHLSCFS